MTPISPSGRQDRRPPSGTGRSTATGRSRGSDNRRASRPSSTIGPVRDTGINVERGSRRRKRRSPSPYGLLIAFSVILIIVLLYVVGHPGTDSDPSVPSAAATTAETQDTVAAEEPLRDPTPLFAETQGLQLRLPVDPTDVTALAFHQASGSAAIHMTALVPDADMELAAELKAVPPLEETATADATTGDEDVWAGCALRLWRSNRSGMPDTAVDCGADAGTVVYAPVSGEVVQIRPYLLYDKYDDYEIHIRPDGYDDIDVVLIHVDELSVSVGDRVTAGASPVAVVRLMSDKVDLQLAGYTSNGGNHVHVQLNTVAAGTDLSGADGS